MNKFFKNSNLKMLYSGLMNLFNGNISLEYRRKVRAAHANLKISEKEFFELSDLVEMTMKEFDMSNEDTEIIISNIRSMKHLIIKIT